MAKDATEQVAPQAAYAQAIKNNNTLKLVVLVLGVLLAIAMFAIVRMLPLKTTELQVIEYQRDTDVFVKVYKPDRSFKDREVVQALYLRQYVKARETVDKITELERYQMVYRSSSNDIWKNFEETHGAKDALYYQKNMKRRIEIIRDAALSPTVHQVEYKTIDTKDDEPNFKREKVWVVTMRYENHTQFVKYADRYSNPLGTVVTEYSYSSRKSKQGDSND